MARARGFHGSMHVTWLGLTSRKDWTIARRAIDDGYVLVTNNTIDFTAFYESEDSEPINEVIEIAVGPAGDIRVDRYDWPARS